MTINIVARFACAAAAVLLLSGCLRDVAPHLKQLPAETQVLLAMKGMKQDAPLFVRIFKQESELEIWKAKDDGLFYHLKTYPICHWSGTLGPKVRQGDKQAPEGFYTVTPGQMNPSSHFHLAFNLGYPNDYDQANGRTGAHLMVHGKCKSAGCFAMTDTIIEEIYILAREAFEGGQQKFQVHAFPFRMTEENLQRHRNSEWYGFWKTLKEGYDSFEQSQKPPPVAVCSRQYLVNVSFLGHEAKPDPQGQCPTYAKLTPDASRPGQMLAQNARDIAAPPSSMHAKADKSSPGPGIAQALAGPPPAAAGPARVRQREQTLAAAQPAPAQPSPAQPRVSGGYQLSSFAPVLRPDPQPAPQPQAAVQAPPPVEPQAGFWKADVQQAQRQTKQDRLPSGKQDKLAPDAPAAPPADFGYVNSSGAQ